MQQQIGVLRERISLLVPVHEPDEMGGYQKSWKTTGINSWASIEAQTPKAPSVKRSEGRALGIGDKGELTYKVKMRFLPFFKADMALTWRDLILVSITPVHHDPRRGWSTFLATPLKDSVKVNHD